MRKVLCCFLVVIVSLVSSCISLEEKIKNVQAEIATINPTDKYITVKIDNKNVKLCIKEDTKITKGASEIEFSDLSMGDKVDISYESVKTLGLWDFGGLYAAKAIKVLE